MGQLSVATDDSDKTSPSLSDMPVDIVGPIIEKLDYRQQLKLRKMSKSFRALVDKLKPACKSIEVVFEYGRVTIKFDEFLVTYKRRKYDDDDDDGIIVIRDDFEKAALDDLASNLKNSKLQLKELSFHFSVHFYDTGKNYAEKYCKKIRKGLECLNHQVSVKEINLKGSSPSCLLSILPYLKPGVLENISFGGDDLNSQLTEMDQVARLDQWKQAEELKLMYCFDRFPMKYATHFKRLYIVAAKIDGDKVIRIKDYLSKLHSFEQCTLSCRRLDKIILATDYEKVAFDDLAFTLKNPKLQLETFLFDSECDGVCCVYPFENNDNRNGKTNNKHEIVQRILKSINHQLSVKACTLDVLSFNSEMPILSHLKPGILEKITIFSAHSNAGRREISEMMQQVELLDQWKQANELELECGFNEWFPVKYATHFKRFHFEERYIYPENLVPIRDFISEHENIEFCSILTFIDLFAKYFDDIVGPAVSPNLYHYTIPDSEYYLEFLIRDNLLTIEKKKK